MNITRNNMATKKRILITFKDHSVAKVIWDIAVESGLTAFNTLEVSDTKCKYIWINSQICQLAHADHDRDGSCTWDYKLSAEDDFGKIVELLADKKVKVKPAETIIVTVAYVPIKITRGVANAGTANWSLREEDLLTLAAACKKHKKEWEDYLSE